MPEAEEVEGGWADERNRGGEDQSNGVEGKELRVVVAELECISFTAMPLLVAVDEVSFVKGNKRGKGV